MQAAQVLAGYSLGEADLLRRAMGKKIQSEMDAQRATLRRGLRDPQRDPGGQGQRAVRLDRQVRRLRLQQEPRRRLCAGRLPDRLAQGASPRRILRRVDELRHGADRQARRSSSRTCAAAGSSACRPTSTPAMRISRSRTARVRYALGALKGVGEKAMEALVEERERGGPFTSLEDFAARIDPRLLNRRQLESLAGAGAFDAIKPDRAAVFAAAETILAHAASAHDQRDQRPGRAVRRQFGRSRADPPAARRVMDAGPAHGGRARRLRLLFLGAPGRRRSATCSPRTRCRTFAELAEIRIAEGERVGATMAGAGRGRALAHLGQGPPLHDGDAVATARASSTRRRSTTSRRAALEAAAKAGACGLLTVELDRRAGDETPRVTIKRFQPLADLAKRTRLQMTVRVADAGTGRARSRASSPTRAAATAWSASSCRSPAGGEAIVVAGRDLRSTASSPRASSASPARGASTSPPRSRRSSPSSARLTPSRSRRGSRGW